MADEMLRVGKVTVDGREIDLFVPAAPKTKYTYPVGSVVTFHAQPWQSQVRWNDGRWRDIRDNQQWGNNDDDRIWNATATGHATVVFEPRPLGEKPVIRKLGKA